MAASQIIKHLEDGTITLTDGAGTPASIVVGFDTGDLTISGLSADQAEIKAYKSRGTTKSVRVGVSTEPSGSFSMSLTDVSDATEATVVDFVMQSGSFNANVSTGVALGDAYLIDLLWTVSYDAETHTVKCEKCAVTMDTAEGEPDTVTFNFTVYGDVTLT